MTDSPFASGMDAVVQNWYVLDCLVALMLVVLIGVFRRLWRREFWRVAMRQLFRRKLVVISSVILSLYTLIALLDSVGYHPDQRDAAGAVVLNSRTGKPIKDEQGVSLLDRMLSGLKERKEKTYSAPFAARQFTKETLVADDGSTQRGHPPLAYPRSHVLGTDRTGQDVLYLGLKGVRTGMVIGALTTLLVIPFAILFGVVAGYLGGVVDDIIQYVYIVLGSIPSILLIVAFMMVFGQGLPQLCIIMGITSWTGLCRILRGETMKLREADYVQACEAMGVPKARIMFRHIVPNVMHIVLITAVLSFSGRVLAEAMLSYIGIGVGAETVSWGMMINDARLELARSPIVWWKLAAAFVFMLGLVLPANLFGDALRDALDPRLRSR